MAEIVDPSTLAILNGEGGSTEITDPALLKVLNQPPAADLWDASKKYGKDIFGGIGTGTLHGIAGIAGLPGDVASLVSTGVGKLFGKPSTIQPWTPALKESASEAAQMVGLPGELYQPETLPGKYAKAMSEGAVSMMSPRLAPVLTGMSAGAGGEAADQLLGHSPYARLLGNVAGMSPAALFAFSTPRIVNTLIDALREAKPDLAAATAAKARNDAALGVDTLLSHGLPQDSGLPGVVREAAATPEGAPIRAALQAEQAAAQGATTGLAEGVTPRPVNLTTAKQVSDIGNAIFSQAGDLRRSMTKPFYEAAGQDMMPIKDIVAKLLGESQAKQWTGGPREAPLTGAASDLTSMARAQGGPGLPATPPGRVLGPNGQPLIPGSPAIPAPQELSAKAVADLGNLNAVTSRAPLTADTLPFQRTSAILSEEAKAGSPALQQADALYKEITTKIINPLKEGPIGKTFPKIPEGSPNTRSWDQMTTLMRDGAPEDIRTLATRLNDQDKTAFPLLVKAGFEKAGGATPEAFFRNVAGDPGTIGFGKTREAFKAQIEQVHLAQGASLADAKAAAEGAANLADSVLQVAKGRATVSGTPQMGTKETAGQNFITQLMKLNIPSWVRTWALGGKVEKMLSRETMGDISKAMTSPDAIERLKDIASYSPTKNAAGVIARAFGSAEIQSQDEPKPLNVWGAY